MLYQALVKIANKMPDKVAVSGEVRSLTFGALLNEVRQIARQLQILGIKPGQTILLGVPPSPDFYSFFYAACALGATPACTRGDSTISYPVSRFTSTLLNSEAR